MTTADYDDEVVDKRNKCDRYDRIKAYINLWSLYIYDYEKQACVYTNFVCMYIGSRLVIICMNIVFNMN